jgi:hypothetical protein
VKLHRRDILALSTLWLIGCASSPAKTPGPASAPAPTRARASSPAAAVSRRPALELAYDNLSYFHGDGERIAVADDGRVLYERMDRGPLMRHELSLADDPHFREIRRVAARLRSEKTSLVDRPGIPDEVRVNFHVAGPRGTITTASVWESDLGKLAPNDVLADALAVVREAARLARTRAASREVPHDETDARWPDVFAPAP